MTEPNSIGQVTTAPYSTLKTQRSPDQPAKIGIDGGHFIALARNRIYSEDPKWALTAGVPPILHQIINDFLGTVKSLDLAPVFVFDGMATSKQVPESDRVPTAITKLALDELDEFSYNHFDDDLVRWIVRKLISLKVEVFTAPYWAWAQLASFLSEENKYVSEVFGAPELLMFEFVERVLVELNNSSAKFLTKKKVEEKIPPHPHGDTTLRHVLNHSKHPFFPQQQPNQTLEEHREMLFQTFNPIIANCPVFTAQGECKALRKLGRSGGNVPSNLREFFFCNLHSEKPLVYFLLFINVLSPTTMSILATTKIVDHPCLIDTMQFRQTLETIIPLRAQIVYQLVQDLDFMSKRDFGLLWMRSFLPQRVTPILKPPDIKLDDWNTRRQRRAAVDQKPTLVNVLQYDSEATQELQVYPTFEQALVAIYLKSLDLLGYFTHAAHSTNTNEVSSVSIYGMALKKAEAFPEQGVLLIELLRTRALHVDPFHLADGSTTLPSTSNNTAVTVAARVMSLFPLNVDNLWDQKEDVSLLAFNSVARTFQRSLRSLTEVIAAKLFMKGCVKFSLAEYNNMAVRLPFHTPLNTYAGLVLLFLLNNNEFHAAPDGPKKIEMLKVTFTQIPEMERQLIEMKKFWDCAIQVVRELVEDSSLDRSVSEALRAADQLVGACFHKLQLK